jgi:hypothetical protein
MPLANGRTLGSLFRASIIGIAVACVSAPRMFAQVRADHPPVGVWRGTSTCTVRQSACNDEIVVYRVSRLNTGDSLSMDARKIVNGQEEEMGVLGCRTTAPDQFTCSMPRGTWHFTVRADSLVGELRLLDSTRFRDVRAVRSR